MTTYSYIKKKKKGLSIAFVILYTYNLQKNAKAILAGQDLIWGGRIFEL